MQTLQRRHHLLHRLRHRQNQLGKVRIQSFDPLVLVHHFRDVIRQRSSLRSDGKLQRAQPAKIPHRKRFTPVARTKPFAQQELAQPIAGAALVVFGILPSAQQIPQTLMRLVGNPHRSQIAAAQKVCELLRIAAIRLHSIA